MINPNRKGLFKELRKIKLDDHESNSFEKEILMINQ